MEQLSTRSRLLVLLSALLLIGAAFLPIWKIQLHAPQYPEGIGMLIRIDTLTGVKPNDLDNLNGLNHYIGMKPITADLFPVLRVMPWVLGGLIGIAILVALTGRRMMLLGWLTAMMLAGAAGLAQFYSWSYDYGHNLAPDAIIKVPGMSYQPPLLGSKQLLNFTAASWPDIGGWLAFTAFLLGAVVLLASRRQGDSRVNLRSALPPLAALLLLVLVQCSSDSVPQIAYGQADCDVCAMRIVDGRFGGAAVTSKGRTNEFDSITCLANYVETMDDLRSVWVSDFDHPGSLIAAGTARFVMRTGPSSEMGSALIALAASQSVEAITNRFGKAPLTWSEVRTQIKSGNAKDQTGRAAGSRHEREHSRVS